MTSTSGLGMVLDKIYNGDIARARQLDGAYLGPQIQQLQTGMASLGPLGIIVAGTM